MTIERCYVDSSDVWEEVTEEEFLRRTEWSGEYRKGTALQALKDAGQIRTPWAFYRIQRQARDYSGRRSGLGDGPISAEGFVDKDHLYKPELMPEELRRRRA